MGRVDRHLAAPLLEAADHVLLDAVIHQSHPQLLHAVGGADLGGLAGHPLHRALHPVGADFAQTVLYTKILRTGDHTVHGALIAENAGDRAGVHPLDPRDIMLFQIGIQIALTAEIAPAPGQMTDHKGLRPRPDGLIVRAVHAVIADERIRHHDALSRIGRVGQDLLVAGHGGVEHHLAHPVSRSADALPVKDRAVAQNEGRFHRLESRLSYSECDLSNFIPKITRLQVPTLLFSAQKRKNVVLDKCPRLSRQASRQ